MKLTDRDRKTVTLGAIGAALILGWLVVFNPLLTRWEKANQAIEEAQQQIQQQHDNQTNRQRAAAALDELERLAWVHEEDGTLREQTALLIETLESTPAYRRLNVDRLQAHAPHRDPPLTRARVNFRFRGHQTELQQLLQELDAARPQLVVESLTLRTSRENVDFVEGDMQVSVVAVVLKGGPD